jgi:alkyl sulfatase BDS1-like metallo-beta-lactamase superfamily hydrolase
LLDGAVVSRVHPIAHPPEVPVPDLLALSAKIIDESRLDIPANRVTQELSELSDGLAIVESFSHSIAFRTDAGLCVFDTSGKFTGRAVVGALRGWSEERVDTIVYTHGHVDHVGGGAAFAEEARGRGRAAPRFVGHENVVQRFARYRRTSGYNLHVNRRQFSFALAEMPRDFLPPGTPEPDVTFSDRLALRVGDLAVELRHARGETDDHAWAWIPERRTLCAGDFIIWNFPNAGNPQKAQRYPDEWAHALREMAALEPELLIPSHGLPIAGAARIARVLDDTAGALEQLVADTLRLMNEGLPLDAIVNEVRVSPDLLRKPYLAPRYDEPEFVVRNVFRLYGGWYDGNPAHLKPAPQGELAREVAALAGGAGALAERAQALAAEGNLRLACHLAEMAVQAEPESRAAHAARFEIYRERRRVESSLMAKGIYGTAARESFAVAHPGEPDPLGRTGGLAI